MESIAWSWRDQLGRRWKADDTKAVFGSRKIFSGKYFQVFDYIMKIILENIFMCLVTFWKCYFPPPPTQNPPPRKPPKHHHPHHHNNNKNQNHTKIKIAQRERSVRGFLAKSKALSRWRSRRLVGRRLWVEDRWVEGFGSGLKVLGSWVI